MSGCRISRKLEVQDPQVVKSYRRRRLVGVTHRVVFGTKRAVAQVLAVWGWTINTVFVERLNLDIRQRVAAIGRRVNLSCLMRVCAKRWLNRSPPTAGAQQKYGDRVPQR